MSFLFPRWDMLIPWRELFLSSPCKWKMYENGSLETTLVFHGPCFPLNHDYMGRRLLLFVAFMTEVVEHGCMHLKGKYYLPLGDSHHDTPIFHWTIIIRGDAEKMHEAVFLLDNYPESRMW